MDVSFLALLFVLQFVEELLSVLNSMTLDFSLELRFVEEVVLSLVGHLCVLNSYS
jgi:hypothetical protein